MERRSFIKSAGLTTAGIGLAGNLALGSSVPEMQNNLPRWRGFNLLDFFSPRKGDSSRGFTSDEEFKWMADWGFNFVRIPMAYPRYVQFDQKGKITPEEVLKFDARAVDQVADLVELANKYGLHVSLDLHRAPGFCVNAGFNRQ